MNGVRQMDVNEVLPDYHKGNWCALRILFCQEGYCSECDTYWQFFRRLELSWENIIERMEERNN